jgi:hypothetical protein
VVVAGIEATQNGTTTLVDGAKVAGNGTNFPIPNTADLVQINPATQDTIALYCAQNSGSSKNIASAWLKTEWVCASSGTVISSPVPAAGWTSGATTLLAAVAAGATTILVNDPTGIVTGAVLQLDTGAATAEPVTVTSVSGQTIGITATSYPHLADAPVTVPVSAAFTNQQMRDKIRFLAYRPIARLTNQGGTQGNLAAQTWPAGTAVQWTSPTTGNRCVDNFTGWASANPTRYTFPLSGTWYLYGQAYIADASSPLILAAGLAISGGTIQWGDRARSVGSTGQGVCATVRRVLRVTAGQYAEVYASQGGGSQAWEVSASQCSHLVAVWRGF